MSARRKPVVAAAAVAALALAGGFAATFTNSTSAPAQKIGSGTLAISLDAVAPTTWTDPIANLAAGDSVARYLNVRNSGSIKISSASLGQTNTLGSLLTSPSDISVQLDGCSVAWTVATGTCSGTASPVLASTSLASWLSGTKSLSGFGSLNPGASAYLKLTTTLAQGAPNAVQQAAGTITYTFGANQRAGADVDSTGTVTTTILGQAATISTAPSATSASEAAFSFTDPTAGKAAYSVSWLATGSTASAQSAPIPSGATSYTLTGLESGKSYDVTLTATQDAQSSTSKMTYVAPTSGINFSTASWSSIASAPTARSAATAAAGTDGIAYVFGGTPNSNGEGSLNTVEKYDPVANKWTTLAPLSIARRAAASAVGADGSLYVFGGMTGMTPSESLVSTTEKYDPKTGTWSTVAPMPTARYVASAVTAADGSIYVIGGFNRASGTNFSTVERYDPVANTWSTKASLPSARRAVSTVLGSDGMIYAIGGVTSSNINAVERYNPATNTWTSMAGMNTARYAPAVGTDSTGAIYAFGGGGGGTSVEKYDIATNKWTAAASLSGTRSDNSFVKGSDGRMYLFGGFYNGTMSTSAERLG